MINECTIKKNESEYSYTFLKRKIPSSKSSSSLCLGKGKQLVISRRLSTTNPRRTPCTRSVPPAPSSWQCLIIFNTTCKTYSTLTSYKQNFTVSYFNVTVRPVLILVPDSSVISRAVMGPKITKNHGTICLIQFPFWFSRFRFGSDLCKRICIL